MFVQRNKIKPFLRHDKQRIRQAEIAYCEYGTQ